MTRSSTHTSLLAGSGFWLCVCDFNVNIMSLMNAMFLFHKEIVNISFIQLS